MNGSSDGSGAIDADEKQLSAWLDQLSAHWTEGRLVELVKRLPAKGRRRQTALLALIALDLRQRWQRGQRARVVMTGPSIQPRARRSAPAQATIAALSVHSAAGGTCRA